MKIGTKSVLLGAHCFFLHPWFVAAAWTKLYGFPWDYRLWFAFFVHDLGYFGLPNMDGPEGENHPFLGARIMHALFDDDFKSCDRCLDRPHRNVSDTGWPTCDACFAKRTYWYDFCLYHSRYFAKKNNHAVSKLCFADKLSFCLTPRWLYLPMVTATGEINEYLKNAQTADSGHWKPTGYDKKIWHKQLCEYMTKWVYEHMDGKEDTWTKADRHAKDESGVTE